MSKSKSMKSVSSFASLNVINRHAYDSDLALVTVADLVADLVSFVSQTIYLVVCKADVETLDKLFAYNADLDSIDSNRDRKKTSLADLARHIPSLAEYDYELSCFCLAGINSGKTTLADGGGRYRTLRNLLLTQPEDNDAKIIIRILISQRPANFGGFDLFVEKRTAGQEYQVKYEAGVDKESRWGDWLAQFGKLLRNRASGNSPKGSGKSGDTWKNKVLTVDQCAEQWSTDFVEVFNFLSLQHGECLNSGFGLFETLQLREAKKWKATHTQYAVAALLDCLDWSAGGNLTSELVGPYVDMIHAELESIGKLWEAYRLVNPKADAANDYSVILQIINDVVSGQKLKNTYKAKPLATLGLSGIYAYFDQEAE